MQKHLLRLWIAALLVAWCFDFLFWKKTPGVSFAIFVSLCVVGGIGLAFSVGVRPAAASLALLLPIGFLASMSFVRLEPLTAFLSYLGTLALLVVFTATFARGRWLLYGIRDYILAALQVAISMLTRPLVALTEKAPLEPTAETNQKKGIPWNRLLPVVRGLLLALPIVVVFAALLASADPIFSARLEDLFSLFDLENIPEYVFRIFYILILAYALAGIYLHALVDSRHESLVGQGQPWPKPFMGPTEAVIILGSVNLLFAFFVGIQFRYFFGGQANIHLEGYTYAEYARRGFGELVTVAFFSLLLFLSLSAITKRQAGRQRWLFSGLGVALTLLVTVMLASAFQRLLLLEQAYGFTRLRTYPHVFMVWLGVLLIWLMVLELTDRLRVFTLALVVACLGFVITLGILDVDAFIVRQNVIHAQAGADLDVEYLAILSPDAIPPMVELYTRGELPQKVQAQLGGALACQSYLLLKNAQPIPWQSYNASRAHALDLLRANQALWSQYPVSEERGQATVTVDHEQYLCEAEWRD